MAAAWLGLLLALWFFRRRWAVVVPVIVLVAVIFFNAWFGPEPRDTLRLAPLLFVLGSVGLTVAGARLASGLRARLGNLRANASVARP